MVFFYINIFLDVLSVEIEIDFKVCFGFKIIFRFKVLLILFLKKVEW